MTIMRVGILTYHYVYNEGAIWQAWSLCTHLRSAFPDLHVEIVDYRHASKHQSIRSRGDSAAMDRREAVLNGCLGPARLESDSPDAALRMIQGRYDAVIVGSDIVWQFDVPRSLIRRLREALESRGALRPSRASPYAFARDVKNWMLQVWRSATRPDPRRIPFPNAYWLSPDLPLHKASFAASIGYSDARRIPGPAREAMRRHLEAFDFLSVRDRPTQAFVASLSPDLAGRVRLAPDPAWLFDAPLPDVERLLRDAGLEPGGRYAGVLFPSRGYYGERLEQWVFPALRERGFKLVSVIDRNPRTDFDLASHPLTPFEWWSVIRSLDFLFTVRTHPSIAALMFQTPLFNVDITAMQIRSRHSKSMDMLEGFGLGDCCIFRRGDFMRERVLTGLFKALDRVWDWAGIGELVGAHRAQCRSTAAEMTAALAPSKTISAASSATPSPPVR